MTIIISLGWNCMPAGFSTHRGWKNKKSEGYKTCPFDIMVTTYGSLCEILKNDFADFANPDFYQIDEAGYITHKKYALIFNHESPNHYGILGTGEGWSSANHFVDNNFKLITERYVQRIENFRNYIKNSIETNELVIFAIIKYNSIPVEIDQILKEKYPELNYKIACISNLELSEEIRSYSLVKCELPENLKNLKINDLSFTGNFIPFEDIPNYL